MGRTVVIGLIAAVAIAAGALGVLELRPPDRSPTPATKAGPSVFKPDSTTVDRCLGDAPNRCYEQAYGNVAYEHGPGAAMERVLRDAKTEPRIRQICHGIAHRIGEAALAAQPGKFVEYLERRDRSCASGVEHGLIAHAFGGSTRQTIGTRIDGVCKALVSDRECGHPVGHGLMWYFGNDLDQALAVCRSIEQATVRRDCYDGTYMVPFTEPGADSGPALIRKGDRYYPCSVAPKEEHEACYWHLAHRFSRTESTWRGRFAACAGAGAGAEACHAGLSRRISLLSTVPAMNRACSASSRLEACFGPAAAQRARADHLADTAAKLCLTAPARVREGCIRQLGSMLGWHFKPAELARECAKTASFKDACLRSAKASSTMAGTERESTT